MRPVLSLLVMVVFLLGCSKQNNDGPFGIWKGMTRKDITDCCQITKTAMVTAQTSVLKLQEVPRPEEPFDKYYVHIANRGGVFGINAGSRPLTFEEGEQIYKMWLDRFSLMYGQPTEMKKDGEVIWESLPPHAGLYRLSLNKGTYGGQMRLGIFYLFDNNQTYQ